MGEVITSRGRIDVDEVGAGDRTPILFLHGVGSDKDVWRPQLDHFGRTSRAIAMSYPGYGESEFVAGATRDDYAASVLALMDALAVDRAHICGLSLGGVVAIAIHAAAAERCASLIIADSFAFHPDGQSIYDRSVAGSLSLGMLGLAEARVGVLLAARASEVVRRDVIETMAAIDPVAYRLGAAAVWLAEQSDRARSIGVPTLILVGEEDRVTPPALSEHLATLIAGSRLEIIAGAGHLANLEQPLVFNSTIDSFLSEID